MRATKFITLQDLDRRLLLRIQLFTQQTTYDGFRYFKVRPHFINALVALQVSALLLYSMP